MLTEENLSRSEIKKLIKDVFDEEFKKRVGYSSVEISTEAQIKEIIKKILRKQYKTFWEKAPFYLNSI